MADNVAISAGSGTTIATDEKTINSTAVQVQRVNLALGKDGTYVGDSSGRTVDGDSNASALFVDNRFLVVKLSTTPTLTTTASNYAAKDCVGGEISFANAVRASGGTARIESITIKDAGASKKNLDIVLFDRSIVANSGTGKTDSAVFDPDDSDLDNCLGWIPIYGSDYSDFNDNSVGSRSGLGFPIKCNATTLYTYVVSRESTAWAPAGASDLTFVLTIVQD